MNQNPYQSPLSSPDDAEKSSSSDSVSTLGCVLVLSTAFIGWAFAGVQMSINSLAMRVAAIDLLGNKDEGSIGQWSGWLICAFLLGAAAGGLIFGRIGDRFGRVKAMAYSIFCYSILSGVSYFVTDVQQLLVLRFFTCMGIGGMWPNGIALVSEAWPNISRPFLAGVIGTAANVGIMCFAGLACFVYITPDNWRWVMLVAASPTLLGFVVLLWVPESPRWLRLKEMARTSSSSAKPSNFGDVFRPPILKTTLLAIALGTVPLFGGWGSSNWAVFWASQVGDQKKAAAGDEATKEQKEKPDPALKARVQLARSAPGSLSSLLGGALAMLIGRRLFYFLLSFAALFCSQYLFWFTSPDQAQFLYWTGALGLFSGFFFGWLPLCLPELFPTRIRSTGAGVSFNFGRILTTIGILVGASLLKELFHGDYAQIGRLTSLVYAVGLVVIFFVPVRNDQELED